MTAYIATGLASCDACFVCDSCGRRVCANAEPVLCAHTDEPTCPDCCADDHTEEPA